MPRKTPSTREQSRRQAQASGAVQMGSTMRRLPQPEEIGELTFKEVDEVKARNAELEWLRDQAQHFNRLVAIASNEKVQFIRTLCKSRKLSDLDEFDLDLERGVIRRTAVATMPEVKAEVPSANGEAHPDIPQIPPAEE